MMLFDCKIKQLREATEEEMEALETADTPPEYEPVIEPEPTTEERLYNVEQRTANLESTTNDMILLMADLIGG